MDHGGSTCWGNPLFFYSDIDSSIYDNVLPFVLSAACLTGAFHNFDDCMAEQFLCSDPIKGAIGFVGAPNLIGVDYFKIIDSYYNSLLNNYSSVLGETLMEMKIKHSGLQSVLKNNNLFGDPALNILYEKTDSINCDLLMKDGYLTYLPENIFYGDTMKITAIFRNLLCSSVTDTFDVSCYAREINSNDSLLIGTNTFAGMESCFDTAFFSLNTLVLPDSTATYEITVYIDPEENVNELDEYNNEKSIETRIYSGFNPLFHISNSTVINSHPVSYNINNNLDGEEIIFGEKVISSTGTVLSDDAKNTIAYTSIANLYNNDEYQIIQFVYDDDSYEFTLETTGNSSWNYTLSSFCFTVNGPVICDMDNNGTEEIIFIEQIIDTNTFTFESNMKCINNNGSLRWESGLPIANYFCTPIIYNQDGIVTIIICGNNGKYIGYI